MKMKKLLYAIAGVALFFGACGDKNSNDGDTLSGISIYGRVVDANDNPISGLRISTLSNTNPTRLALGTSLEDSIANAEKGFVKWEGSTGEIIIPDTIATDNSGNYLIINEGENFAFTGELPIIVIKEGEENVLQMKKITVTAADYKKKKGYKSFAELELNFVIDESPAEDI